jgi:hypothetical protein
MLRAWLDRFLPIEILNLLGAQVILDVVRRPRLQDFGSSSLALVDDLAHDACHSVWAKSGREVVVFENAFEKLEWKGKKNARNRSGSK